MSADAGSLFHVFLYMQELCARKSQGILSKVVNLALNPQQHARTFVAEVFAKHIQQRAAPMNQDLIQRGVRWHGDLAEEERPHEA